MKKIAFVVRMFQIERFYAGGEKFIYQIIKEFIRNNYIIDIYCEKSETETPSGINKIIVNNCHSHDYIETEKHYQKLNDEINQNSYDYVITDGVTPYSETLLLQVFSKKYNLAQILYYKIFKPEKLIQSHYEEKWLTQERNKIIVVSNKLKQHLIKKYKIQSEKISVIYPGAEEFSENLTLKPQNQTPYTFGISATFFKRKGGLLFLLALIITKLRGQKYNAIMILRNTSKAILLKKILKLFNMEQNVTFFPFQETMTDFYSQINCLVMPSHEEAFGLVALEAMLNKIPTIVSSCSGISEILQDKVNGNVFKFNLFASFNLANKMIQVVNNSAQAEECLNNAYITAKKYNWDLTFTEIKKALK
ncbi:MAG: glycosyltransferase family 4 protein [Candidatus Gastranaerophilaceae bacterium]|jgi:glycosyltransferase involved in cell wall biosynthesis